MNIYTRKIDRRVTLKWLAATAAVAAAPTNVLGLTADARPQKMQGYGRDPDLLDPTVPWDKTMSERELALAAAFGDVILPAEDDYPAPSALGIPEFMDEWVSAPYPKQQEDADTILAGLAWLDKEAKRRGADGFPEAVEDLQIAITAEIAEEANDQFGFFYRFRFVLLGAYYTTSVGFRDIGYIGNVPLESYPGPSPEHKAHIDRSLRQMGVIS